MFLLALFTIITTSTYCRVYENKLSICAGLSIRVTNILASHAAYVCLPLDQKFNLLFVYLLISKLICCYFALIINKGLNH